VLVNRSGIHRNLRDFQAALRDLDRALELAPGLGAAIYINRGLTHFSLGDMDAALADMNAAVEVEPENAMAYGQRALIRLTRAERQGADTTLLDAAWSDVEQAIARDPALAISWIVRGRIRHLRNDMAGGLEDLIHARFRNTLMVKQIGGGLEEAATRFLAAFGQGLAHERYYTPAGTKISITKSDRGR